MKNKMLIALMAGMLLIVLALSQSASADLIDPTHKYVPIQNRITNINDFPDYVFISYGQPGCKLTIVGSDGIISPEGEYKFCRLSVYAIEKDKFNESEYQSMRASLNDSKVVLTDIVPSEYVSVSDTRTEIVHEYTIDRNLISVNEPTNVIIGRNQMFYFFIIAPIVAVALIAWFLIKRRKEQ